MKTKICFFLVFIAILMACKKEPTEEDSFNRLKSAHMEIPMEFDFSIVHDWTVPQINCIPELTQVILPGKEWLQGTATHMGVVNVMTSYALVTGCVVIDTNHLKEYFEGIITSESGDYFNYSGWGLIDLTNVSSSQLASITGEITINDGDGRFVDVKGTMTITGKFDFSNGSIDWEGEGFIIYE